MSPLAIDEQVGGIFEIEREIARGGMGVVYAARDTRHGRRVAVRVLSQEAGGGIGRDRFEREIAVIAQLNHPNILALFEPLHPRRVIMK